MRDEDAYEEGDWPRRKEDELAEDLAAAVADEISDRVRFMGSTYPFTFDGATVQAKNGADSYVYTFLLTLSLVHPITLDGRDPTRIFEDVSAVAAERFYGGPHNDVLLYQFGSPRRVRPSGFVDAIDEMCVHLGEGRGAKKRPTTSNQKDAGLDIVVSRRFPDRRAGQMIGFGQCAAGSLWRDKLTDLVPKAFCQLWLNEPPAVEPGRLFFLPFCIDAKEWADTAIKAGIVFDRYRISLLASSGTVNPLRADVRGWTASALRRLRT